MAYVILPNQGLHFSLPNYPNCVLAAYDTGGVGEVVILGTAPVGSIEYDAIKVLWGPGDMNGLSMTEGPFLNNLILPAANAAIANFTTQNAPAVQGTDPVNLPNTNNALWQYLKLDNGQLVVKPYP